MCEYVATVLSCYVLDVCLGGCAITFDDVKGLCD